MALLTTIRRFFSASSKPPGEKCHDGRETEASDKLGRDIQPLDFDRKLQDEIDCLESHQHTQWEDWKGREYAIQPHTDAAGQPYHIGNLYEGIRCDHEWKIDNRKPYLEYIKAISPQLPHLAYLGHWMEVTAAPPKWKYLRYFPGTDPGHREERASRANVCVLDYSETHRPAHMTRFTTKDKDPGYVATAELQSYLENNPQSDAGIHTRLFVVEDLSRDLVEMLGSTYDIDPQFFSAHIDDYLFHNTRDPWVELPTLDVDARQQCHFNLQYLRARYFTSEEDFKTAEYDSGMFNVLRRLDSDRSRKRLQSGLLDRKGDSVTLMRAKTSLWCKPRKDGKGPVTCILLVDPTVSKGRSLWGGYRPFKGIPTLSAWKENRDSSVDVPEQKSLFEDIVQLSRVITEHELALIQKDPRNIALQMYKLVIADWLASLKYMTTILTKVEWEFDKPHWTDFAQTDAILKKLSPWRRNIPFYQTMVTEAMARLFPSQVRAPFHGSQPNGIVLELEPPVPPRQKNEDKDGIPTLWTDFRNVKQQMNESQARIRAIEAMAMNSINAEEARRAVKQNKNLARLTFLATLFIPLSFTSSFLSISTDFDTSTLSFKLFFAIGIPLTFFALIGVDLLHPNKNGYLRKGWNLLKKKFAPKAKPILPLSTVDIRRKRPSITKQHTSTISWFTTPNATIR